MSISDFPGSYPNTYSSPLPPRIPLCVICKSKPVWKDPYTSELSPYCGNTCRRQDMRDQRRNQMCKLCKVKPITSDHLGYPTMWCSKSCRDKDPSFYSSSNKNTQGKSSSLLKPATWFRSQTSMPSMPDPKPLPSNDLNAPPPYVPHCTEEFCNEKCTWDDRGVLYRTCGAAGCLTKEKREETKRLSVSSEFYNTGTSSTKRDDHYYMDHSQDNVSNISRNPVSNCHDISSQSSISQYQPHNTQGESWQYPLTENSQHSASQFGIPNQPPPYSLIPNAQMLHLPFHPNQPLPYVSNGFSCQK